MKTAYKLIAGAAVACASLAAQALVLTFDDRPNGQSFFTSNYNGFQIGTNNISNTDWFSSDQLSPFYAPHSGTKYIGVDSSNFHDPTNSHEPAQPIIAPFPINFQGAWFTGDPASTITYALFNGATLVATSVPSAGLSATPQFVASGYSGPVTSIVVIGRLGFFALDDLTYDPAAPVPEPGTWALMIGGLAAVAAVAKRRRG